MNKKNNPETLRNDFPLLKSIAYLDNAATTQKPRIVIDALKDFYENSNANAHRGVYKLSEAATKILEDSRKKFSSFINAWSDEIVFTKNATEGFNQLARSITRTYAGTYERKGSLKEMNKMNIVTTEIEHHSNFVPWQQACKSLGMEFRVVRYDAARNANNLEDISRFVDKNTLVATFTGMSNVTGLKPDVKNIVKKIRKKNPDTIIIIDATQLVAHEKIDVKALDADFVVFSAHKLYGTTGVGIVYGKKALLEKIEPFFYGGNMIDTVSISGSTWADVPDKFEAGTMDVAGIYASSKAIDYLNEKGFDELMRIESVLKDYALKKLRLLKFIKIIGHEEYDAKEHSAKERDTKDYGPVISFISSMHPHDIATICDRHDVCIRAGHHCAQPFMKALGVAATSRLSLSFYNSEKDIDKLIDAITAANKLLGDHHGSG